MVLKLLATKLSETAVLPEKAHGTDAGIDFFSNEEVEIGPYDNAKVGTGIAVAIPEGYCLVIKDRSGLATKTRTCVVAGVIDEAYRGQVIVAYENHGPDPLKISRGMKIAQALLLPVPAVEIEEVDELDDTDRGDGGFGSTGS